MNKTEFLATMRQEAADHRKAMQACGHGRDLDQVDGLFGASAVAYVYAKVGEALGECVGPYAATLVRGRFVTVWRLDRDGDEHEPYDTRVVTLRPCGGRPDRVVLFIERDGKMYNALGAEVR